MARKQSRVCGNYDEGYDTGVIEMRYVFLRCMKMYCGASGVGTSRQQIRRGAIVNCMDQRYPNIQLALLKTLH